MSTKLEMAVLLCLQEDSYARGDDFILAKDVFEKYYEKVSTYGFDTIASGDSYNDLGMIQASKAGFLFRSTDKIKADYPQIPAYETYEELLGAIKKAMEK